MDHRKVLVVDDDPTVRRMLAAVFRQKALSVDEADGGEAAISLLREHAYGVVLLDLLMPRTTGFDVLDAMRKDVPAPPVVLVITGAPSEVVGQLDPNRMHGIIKKPFDPEEVASIVAACADIRERSVLDAMGIGLAGSALAALLATVN